MAEAVQRALVVGASGGIGAALVAALSGGGWSVTALSRRDTGLDVTDEGSVALALGTLEAPFELILIATGALEIAGVGPEKSLRALDPAVMAAQFALNAIGPAMILKYVPRLLPRDRRAVIAALSARVGSIGDNHLGGWYSYRAAKAALNQLVHTAAIEIGRSHKQAICVALHPGTVATALTANHGAGHPAIAPPEAAANLLAVIAGLGTEASGGFFDWQGSRVPW